MKKLIVCIVVFMCTIVAVNAQSAEKKNWIGGGVSFGSSKTDGYDRATNYSIVPQIGFMLSDNIGLGVKLGYGHTEVPGQTPVYVNGELVGVEPYTNKSNSYSINPFIRYTFVKGNIGGLFIDGGFAYAHSKLKSSDTKTNTFSIGVSPGVMFNVSDKIALLGTFGFLGYTQSKTSLGNKETSIYKTDYKSNDFSFNLNMDNITLGMNFLF